VGTSPGTTAAPLAAFRLEVQDDGEDAAVAALWERGTTGVHVQPGPSGKVVLVAYFLERPGLEADLRAGLGERGAVGLERIPVPDVDWVARFREGFRPFRVGGFHVLPAWEAEDRSAEKTGIPIRIFPARAFGTGTHESTRLCLSALESLATLGGLGRVLDVGGGTGILGVAAALLGARPVTVVDIDAEAVESARHHAQLNGVDVHVVRGDGGLPLAGGRFDLVLANLTAPLLLERRNEIAGLCAPSASLALSGFLREDARAMVAAYGSLGPAAVTADGEWAAVVIGPLR
jgi:ribosomal protein L11 methyltransferase